MQLYCFSASCRVFTSAAAAAVAAAAARGAQAADAVAGME